MLKTYQLLNKFTFEITNFKTNCNLKIFPSYYIILGEFINKVKKSVECSICLNEIKSDFYKTDCNHIFHRNCFEQWLLYNRNCPLCRAENTYVKLSHFRQLAILIVSPNIPLKNFIINLGYKYLMFNFNDFMDLYRSSPVLWNVKYKLDNIYLEPVFKLGNIYISCCLRNTILFDNKYNIDNIKTSNQICNGNILLFLDCENEKFNRGIIKPEDFRILYEWIFEVMKLLEKERNLDYNNIMNTQILNIIFSYIYYNPINRSEHQKLACIAMYLCHNKKIEMEFFEYICDYTYNVKELNEFVKKVEKYY